MTTPGPHRTTPVLALFVHAITAVVWIAPIWAGWRLASSGSTVLGIGLAAVGLVSLILAGRRFFDILRRPNHSRFAASGELPREQFDYIIWTAVGLPLVFVILLVATAISGGLD